MDDLKKTGFQDRSKINMHEPHEVHCWTRHFGVTRERLQQTIDKVGNSAKAVRKELGHAQGDRAA
jgi:uncharacterized protein DUF3606